MKTLILFLIFFIITSVLFIWSLKKMEEAWYNNDIDFILYFACAGITGIYPICVIIFCIVYIFSNLL